MILAIVQARMNSSRLPGKVLQEIAGRPMLWHVVNRTQKARHLDGILVATSLASADDPIAEFCSREQIPCFRGSEDDVLDRYYQAARHFQAKTVVRVTADCPLLDPEVIDKVIAAFQSEGCDYATNALRYTYPHGLDVEVFSFAALQCAWQEAASSAHREHVTDYIRTAGKFRLVNVENEQDLSQDNHRWTVDHPCDLEFVREVYQALGANNDRLFLRADVLDLLRRRPELRTINQHQIRHEGYYLSLLHDNQRLPPRIRLLEKTRQLLAGEPHLIPAATPVLLERGQGSQIWDVDGNQYIDYCLNQGQIILGHANAEVSQASAVQHGGNSSHSPVFLKEELTERLLTFLPWAKRACFGRTASELLDAAISLACQHTGRDKIVRCAEDARQPTSTALANNPPLRFAYNDLAGLQQLLDQFSGEIAAVVLEPVGLIEPEYQFLTRVKEETQRCGSVLIFDEQHTGFRLALGGAAQYFGVIPDLAIFGNTIANGRCLAALVGPDNLLKHLDRGDLPSRPEDVASVVAALATCEVLQSRPVSGHLWELGQKLKDGYNVMARELGLLEYTRCLGLAPRLGFRFSDHNGVTGQRAHQLFQQELLNRGIFLPGYCHVSFGHTEGDIDATLRAFRDALEKLAQAINSGNPRIFLEDDPMQPISRIAG